jgi:hypothetical protein
MNELNGTARTRTLLAKAVSKLEPAVKDEEQQEGKDGSVVAALHCRLARSAARPRLGKRQKI